MWELTLPILISCLVATLALLYKWSVSTFDHWNKKGVPYDSDNLYPFVGNMKCCFRGTHLSDLLTEMYNKYKGKNDFMGFYATRQPTFIPLTADLTYSVLIKDFSHFYDRGFHNDEKYDVIANSLFFINGALWKYQRNKLSPTFTSGKLRSMTGPIDDTVNIFLDYMKKFSGQEVDTEHLIRECIICFIGKVVCGLDLYSIENPDVRFKDICTNVLKPKLRTAVKSLLQFSSPYLSKKMKFFEPSVENYFRELTEDALRAKAQGARTKDFLQLIIDLHNEDLVNKDSKEGYFDKNSVIGNLAVFLIAGQETSTNTLSMLLYHLSQHKHVKTRLVEEIDSVLKTIEGDITYDDAMKKFPYLNMVLEESMRVYPLVYILNRVVTKPYQIPGTDISLEEGTAVIIPVLALHNDPRYWTEPDKYDPERFSPENRDKIVPGSYMPFGMGPRMCIGNRLALLDMKILLIKLLHKFDVTATDRTPKKVTFDHKNPNTLISTHPLYLRFTLRDTTL